MASAPISRRSAFATYYATVARYHRIPELHAEAEDLAIVAVSREFGMTKAAARALLFARLP